MEITAVTWEAWVADNEHIDPVDMWVLPKGKDKLWEKVTVPRKEFQKILQYERENQLIDWSI